MVSNNNFTKRLAPSDSNLQELIKTNKLKFYKYMQNNKSLSENKTPILKNPSFSYFVKTPDKKQNNLKKKIGKLIRRISEKKSNNFSEVLSEIYSEEKLPNFRAKGKFFVREVL